MRTGVWLYPIASASELVDAIVRLDANGIDEVWIADEGVAREPFSILAAAARETSQITLAVGITSPLLRHPGAVAATAKTVDELSNGRVILGWGVGGHESLGPFGLSTERPVGILRDAMSLARAVMDGKSIPGYTPPAHCSPPRHIRQYIGARGLQLNRLASASADGVFLSGLTEVEIPRVIGDARSVRSVEVALYQSVSFNGDGDDRCVAGTTAAIASKLRSLHETYSPHSLGVALTDRLPLDDLISEVLELFQALADP